MFKFFFIKCDSSRSGFVCAYALLCVLITTNALAEEPSFVDCDIGFDKQANRSVSGGNISTVFKLAAEGCKQV